IASAQRSCQGLGERYGGDGKTHEPFIVCLEHTPEYRCKLGMARHAIRAVPASTAGIPKRPHMASFNGQMNEPGRQNSRLLFGLRTASLLEDADPVHCLVRVFAGGPSFGSIFRRSSLPTCGREVRGSAPPRTG